MSIAQSIGLSLFCISLVFFVLICLFFLIKLLSVILSSARHNKSQPALIQAEASAPAAKELEEDNRGVSAGELKLINVDEKTAAMIMAIVSHESGIPLSQLSFKSIRALEES
ncbi:oxaloacetate decarboxylase gamma subunit [Anaerobacterium chartisolvens]|uniref:Oxaloacetate decarboxylase gamma subunit n=1 Tax=Anaerobacterium chartisolvens TaxID=1297424 RepID=A0A369BA64_9FIRM|nr:OadG family protein [Anaerobacterium chartisolvens]RCX18412.1 oxaloacetate decarboxylase gamma subunit [Anaerobacterium chartisolvens]